MDELIHRFLIQCGFPRASIVTDMSLLPLSESREEEGAGVDSPLVTPDFAIVDPANGDRLALLKIVGAADAEALRFESIELGRYARRFGGRGVQGFVVRVDARGRNESEQVQFYRVWPNETLQQLSVKLFPDLDTLRTAQLLDSRRTRLAAGSAAEGDEGAREVDATAARRASRGGGALVLLPGLAILALAIADWWFARTRDAQLLSETEALLLVGAATLLLVPSLVDRCRRR